MQEKEKGFLRSLRDGREDLQHTKKEYRKHTRRVARKFSKQQTAIVLDKCSKRDPDIYDMLKQRKTTCPSPVPTHAWNTYLLSHFNAKPPPKPPDTLNRNSKAHRCTGFSCPFGLWSYFTRYGQNCRCLWLSESRCYDVPGLQTFGYDDCLFCSFYEVRLPRWWER